MEHDFTYDRSSRRFSLSLSAEHEMLGRFLLDEFGQQPAAYQPLIDQLSALKPYQSLQYQGREYLLQVEKAEVTLSLNGLLQQDATSHAQLQALELDESLQLDEHGSSCQCGLEDLLQLLRQWQQFLMG
ncbi:YacL family protein [Arsukibacterium sp.]|uniref:YacL family protein n=1 Tax=Arsukibacterium sp. TaxID=1977258 RepID=UPI002FD90063